MTTEEAKAILELAGYRFIILEHSVLYTYKIPGFKYYMKPYHKQMYKSVDEAWKHYNA